MATYGKYESIPGLLATSTFAAKQYYVVKVSSTAGYCKPASTANDEILGVIQNDAAASEVCDVAFLGIGKAAAETSVAYGDALTASATGRVKTTTTNGHKLIGYAMEASATAGDIIRVTLAPGWYRATS